MNCPICGHAMELGYIAAGGYRIKWTPKFRSLFNIAGENEVQLQTHALFGKNQCKAYRCWSCRKIILEY